MPKKVTVVGAGNVGATCAQRIIEDNLADVVLIDVVEGLAAGKALDMMQSAPIMKFESRIEGATDFSRSAGSDVIVITAGLARKPGMSRDDLLFKNAAIIKDIVLKVAPLSPQAVIIVVTNPLDVMCYVAYKYSAFPPSRVIGMAGELDGARLSHFVREATQAKVSALHSVVLGTHGDAMVPLARLSTVGGTALNDALPQERVTALIEKTQNGGAEIVGLLKTGSAYYAPSAAAFAMTRSILTDANDVFCCSVWLEGAYNIYDTFCGVPVTLGRQGVKKIVELSLTDAELLLLQNSSVTIKENIAKALAF